MSGSVGIAVASVFAVGILGTLVSSQLIDNPTIPASLKVESGINLDQVNFVPNDQLVVTLENTSATKAQIDEAIRINTEARLRALRTSLLVLAGLSLLAIIPAGRMPNEVPALGRTATHEGQEVTDVQPRPIRSDRIRCRRVSRRCTDLRRIRAGCSLSSTPE